MKALKKIAGILPWVLAVTAVIAAVMILVYADRAEIDYDTEAKVAGLQENNAGLQSKADDLLTKVVTLKSKVVGLQIDVKSLQEELDEKYSGDGLRWEMEFKAEELEALIEAMPDDDPNAIDIIAKYLFDLGTYAIGDIWYNGTELLLPFVDVYSDNPDLEIKRGERTYSKCDMLYSDFVKIYSGIFTGEALDDFENWIFTEKDGYLYAVYGGGMTGVGTTNLKLTRASEKDDEIKYNVSYSDSYIDGSESARTCSMTIKSVNGSWRISEFDYLNIKDYWKD